MCTLTGLPGIAFGAVSFFLNRLKIPIFVSPTSFLKGIIVKFGILYYNIDMSERRNLYSGGKSQNTMITNTPQKSDQIQVKMDMTK